MSLVQKRCTQIISTESAYQITKQIIKFLIANFYFTYNVVYIKFEVYDK